MNRDVEYYRFSGNPAIGSVTVVGIPATGDTVTIGGVVFTMGTDVYVPTAFPGAAARGNFQNVAEALTAAINCDKTRSDMFNIGVHSNPVRPYYAIYFGNIVRIIVSNPSTLGSSVSLATSNNAVFTISGSTFVGGGEGAATGAGDASAANQVTMISAVNAMSAKLLDFNSSSRISSAALESGHVIKNAAGKLIMLTGYNSGPQQYIHIYNSTTVPADGAVPVWFLKVEASSNFSFVCPTTGVPFTTGIACSNSTTLATKTFGANDCMYTAVFV